MLTLRNINRTIGHFTLKDVSLHVPKGAYLILLGPTGCGKTVLLETIAGVGRPDSGYVFIGETDATAIPPEKRNIGFVYQRSMLFPNHTVLGNICYGMRLRKMSSQEQKKRVDALAGMLGIEHLLGRNVQNLSGGESQKVALARALAIEPPLLLLDEPLAPVDPFAREGLRTEILRLHRELGTTIIHVEHDQATARIMADALGVMQNGSLMQFGQAAEVFEQPNSEFVARFLGMENVLHGVAHPNGDHTVVSIGDITIRSHLWISGQVGICIAPEAIRPAANGTKFGNELDCMVTDISQRGSFVKMGMQAGGHSLVMTMGRGEYESQLVRVGARIKVGFEPDRVHCFRVQGD